MCVKANYPAVYGCNSSKVVDTPDEAKAALGDKIGDRAVKLDKSANAGSFLANKDFYSFAVVDNKIKYIITINLYVEDLNSTDVYFIFSGSYNEFVIYENLKAGANEIVLELTPSSYEGELWNVGCHMGDFVGYVGDITIERIHT